MNFGVRWEDESLEDLKGIYGDLETADAAIGSVDWQLARNPLRHTWELKPNSGVRLAWVKPYRGFPAAYLSFEIVIESENRYCLVKRARRANDPSSS